ncbi:RAMP superfamily CRISPR-associated protein (plasmid) [Tistrella mobilis]|uniref:RAMP superfamily CRISPR-associated protein n=1 Tax=Tistrella mobilis TaxID=171437 RepID=UPI003558F98A
MSDAFRPSDVITARFELSAPMFSGQEGDKGSAEIRPTEIKAALRFWWRALAWGRGVRTPQALKEQEDALFGAAADEGRNGAGGRGQGAFLLRVRSDRVRRIDPGTSLPMLFTQKAGQRQPTADAVAGAQYAGYGLIATGKKPTTMRPGIHAGNTFDVILLPRPTLTTARKAQLLQAVKLFGLLGGIGGRVRRGFGSVTLRKLIVDGRLTDGPADIDDYIAEVQELMPTANTSGEPDWTAFFGTPSGMGTLCGITSDVCASPLSVIGAFGHGLKSYRKDLKAGVPQKIALGLPQHHKGSSELSTLEAGKKQGRRASPVMLHVHRLSDGYVGVVTVFPGRFLPDDARIAVFPSGGSPQIQSHRRLHASDAIGVLGGPALPVSARGPIKIEDQDMIFAGQVTDA